VDNLLWVARFISISLEWSLPRLNHVFLAKLFPYIQQDYSSSNRKDWTHLNLGHPKRLTHIAGPYQRPKDHFSLLLGLFIDNHFSCDIYDRQTFECRIRSDRKPNGRRKLVVAVFGRKLKVLRNPNGLKVGVISYWQIIICNRCLIVQFNIGCSPILIHFQQSHARSTSIL
jgi:hypothetical protein